MALLQLAVAAQLFWAKAIELKSLINRISTLQFAIASSSSPTIHEQYQL